MRNDLTSSNSFLTQQISNANLVLVCHSVAQTVEYLTGKQEAGILNSTGVVFSLCCCCCYLIFSEGWRPGGRPWSDQTRKFSRTLNQSSYRKNAFFPYHFFHFRRSPNLRFVSDTAERNGIFDRI